MALTQRDIHRIHRILDFTTFVPTIEQNTFLKCSHEWVIKLWVRISIMLLHLRGIRLSNAHNYLSLNQSVWITSIGHE